MSLEEQTILLDLVQRVTRIETAYSDHHRALLERMDRIVEEGGKQEERLRAVENSLTKYQGFWGAITLIGSAIVTCVTLFWDFVKEKLFG